MAIQEICPTGESMARQNRIAIIIPILLIATVRPVFSLDIQWCRQPIGLQNGFIPDSALSASSAFDNLSVGPQHARLHVDRNGGAWCPKQQIAENVIEYLQIDLGNITVISGIATQGRYGNGRGQEYTEQFRLEYFRPELSVWRPYRRWDGKEILEGNSDTKSAVHQDLNPAIMATRLRIIPFGIYPRTVCIRAELYGCMLNENVVSYSIPVGDAWSEVDGLTISLDDRTYDGVKKSESTWNGGLGALTDGHYGLDNFKMDLGNGKGHGWVGWRNVSSPPIEPISSRKSIALFFKFGSLRNFTAVHIHANNLFTQNVQVFSRATVSFSMSGSTFGGAVNYYYMEDNVLENARNVSIQIPNMCAAFIKIQLWFSSHWILISEVTFDSEFAHTSLVEEFNFIDEREDDNEIEDEVLKSSTDPPLTAVFNTESALNHDYFEAVVGALSAVMLLLIIAIVIIILMNHRKKTMQETPVVIFSTPSLEAGVKIAPPHVEEMAAEAFSECSVSKSLCAGSIPELQYVHHTTCIEKTINDPEDSGYSRSINTSSRQRESSISKFSSLRTNHLPALRCNNANSLNSPFPRIATDPIARRSTSKSIQLKTATVGLMWNIKPLSNLLPAENTSNKLHQVPEIPRQSLRLIDWMGSSAHGEAYVCHIVNNNEESVSTRPPVVVRGGPVKETKNFQAEIKVLSSLQHENICRLMAYSHSNGTGWMIYECPEYGDLKTYLKQQTVELSTRSMLKLAVQIATATVYLEGRGLAHRDLALRNCLLGPEFQVKVSDIAVVCSAFQEDYGEVRGRKSLPIRWLPWEMLVLDKFSQCSGVWMLAVTVWELATSAREKPYNTMNDAQVILNADHFYYSDGKQVVLPQPKGRPCQLYKWMTSCWSRDENKRPTFYESACFLDQLSDCY